MRRKDCRSRDSSLQYYVQTGSWDEQTSYPKGTGFCFQGRTVDVALTHIVLQLMVSSDLPSYLHAFEGMVLRIEINFIFCHSNYDHKVIILGKHK
jgi:hypothetical protein